MSSKTRPTDFAERWNAYRGTSYEPGIQEKFSKWYRIKKFLGNAWEKYKSTTWTDFIGGDWKSAFEKKEPTISRPPVREAAQEIITLNYDISPQELADELKDKGYTIEEIRGSSRVLMEVQ